jgi:DNA-binding GntR family transcriptional regulator
MEKSPQPLLPVTRPSTLSDQVTARLRDAILRGTLAGGTHVPEAQTAQTLGVSRVPVREALVELKREGLVHFDDRGRAIVRKLTPKDRRDILDLRCSLEDLSWRLACQKLSPADLQRLEDILAKAARTKDLTEFSRLDIAFHDEIVRIADNAALLQCWRGLRSQLELWLAELQRRWQLDRHDVREVTLKTHRQVIEILKKRNPDLAAATAREHCEGWRKYIADPE